MPDFEITAPDGRKFIVTAPDGASQDEILSYAQKMAPGGFSYTDPSGAVTNDRAVAARWQGEANAKPGTPSLGQQFTRSLGLGVRDAIEGVGQLPGMAYDALRAPGRAITSGINAVAGTNIPAGYSSQDILTGAGDVLGLPTAETRGERLRSDIGKNVAGLIPSMGAGSAMGPAVKVAAGPSDSLMARLLGNTTGEAVTMAAAGPMATKIGAALATAPLSQVVGAAGAGLSGGIARENGAGPMGQFGASLAGGITGAIVPTVAGMAGRGMASMVQPFSQGGREKIVGEALLRNSSDPETLATRLMAGADDEARRLPGAPVTSAVAARDPQMLMLESGLRSDVQTAPGVMSPAAALRDVDARRNAVRVQTIEALQRGEGDAAARGVTVREGLGFGKDGQGARQAMKARTDQLYDAVNQAEKFPLAPIADTLAGVEKTYFGNLSGGMPAELASLRDDVLRTLNRGTAAAPTQQWMPPAGGGFLGSVQPRTPQTAMVAPGEVDWRSLQNLRSRAQTIAGQAAASRDNPTAAAAGKIVETIDNIGMSPEWMAATAQRREVGQALGRDTAGASATGRIMNRDQFGMPLLPDERVPVVALGSPNSARQTLGAFDKAIADAKAAGLPEDQITALTAQQGAAKQALRDQFAEDLLSASRSTTDIADATGNVTRQLAPSQFTRFWEKKSPIADVLFDGAERKTLDRLASDFAETSVMGTARSQGSPTAQNLSVGNFIARLTNGTIDPQNPLAQSLGKLGPITNWLVSSPEQAMREMLVQALRDPKFAAQLTQKAGPDSLERAVLYWQRSMPERLRDASLEALTREVPRIGLSEPSTGRGPMPRPTAR